MQKRNVIQVIAVLLIVTVLTGDSWIQEAQKTAHIMPDVPKTDVTSLLFQESLSLQELNIVSEQTGIYEDMVKELLEDGKQQELLALQEAYFSPVRIKSKKTTPLTVCEYVINERGDYQRGSKLVDLQDGDILITKNSRFLGWRNGHAGLVVDAENGLVLEAVMLGTNTRLCKASGWEIYPSFQVLRLKEELRETYPIEKAIIYAEEELVDVPYHLLAGIWERIIKGNRVHAQESEAAEIAEAALSGTQCAHLIWYAYQQIGIDLDSDGGFLVTPYDIQKSPYLEVIQSYGYENWAEK